MKRYDNDLKYMLILRDNAQWELKEYNPGQSLKMLQAACEGNIDLATTEFREYDIDMWVNDEFSLNNSNINFKAALGSKQHICGNVAFLKGDHATSESHGLTKEECLDIILHCEGAFAKFLKDAKEKDEARNE